MNHDFSKTFIRVDHLLDIIDRIIERCDYEKEPIRYVLLNRTKCTLSDEITLELNILEGDI